jgi:HEAT repeat protein
LLEERFHIVKALGQIGDARIVRRLLESVDAAQVETDREMLSIGGAETAQQSQQRIRNLHQYEDAVYDALEKIGAPAVDELILAVGDENKWIRENASQLLGKINDPCAVEPLLIALGNKDGRIRNLAASVLGKIGDVRAVPSLLDALKDEDENVRRSTAFALGKCGDPRAVEPLIAGLKSESLWNRREAALLLGNLHNAAALEPLQALLEDTDESVRIAASEAIAKITSN